MPIHVSWVWTERSNIDRVKKNNHFMEMCIRILFNGDTPTTNIEAGAGHILQHRLTSTSEIKVCKTNFHFKNKCDLLSYLCDKYVHAWNRWLGYCTDDKWLEYFWKWGNILYLGFFTYSRLMRLKQQSTDWWGAQNTTEEKERLQLVFHFGGVLQLARRRLDLDSKTSLDVHYATIAQ